MFTPLIFHDQIACTISDHSHALLVRPVISVVCAHAYTILGPEQWCIARHMCTTPACSDLLHQSEYCMTRLTGIIPAIECAILRPYLHTGVYMCPAPLFSDRALFRFCLSSMVLICAFPQCVAVISCLYHSAPPPSWSVHMCSYMRTTPHCSDHLVR